MWEFEAHTNTYIHTSAILDCSINVNLTTKTTQVIWFLLRATPANNKFRIGKFQRTNPHSHTELIRIDFSFGQHTITFVVTRQTDSFLQIENLLIRCICLNVSLAGVFCSINMIMRRKGNDRHWICSKSHVSEHKVRLMCNPIFIIA